MLAVSPPLSIPRRCGYTSTAALKVAAAHLLIYSVLRTLGVYAINCATKSSLHNNILLWTHPALNLVFSPDTSQEYYWNPGFHRKSSFDSFTIETTLTEAISSNRILSYRINTLLLTLFGCFLSKSSHRHETNYKGTIQLSIHIIALAAIEAIFTMQTAQTITISPPPDSIPTRTYISMYENISCLAASLFLSLTIIHILRKQERARSTTHYILDPHLQLTRQ